MYAVALATIDGSATGSHQRWWSFAGRLNRRGSHGSRDSITVWLNSGDAAVRTGCCCRSELNESLIGSCQLCVDECETPLMMSDLVFCGSRGAPSLKYLELLMHLVQGDDLLVRHRHCCTLCCGDGSALGCSDLTISVDAVLVDLGLHLRDVSVEEPEGLHQGNTLDRTILVQLLKIGLHLGHLSDIWLDDDIDSAVDASRHLAGHLLELRARDGAVAVQGSLELVAALCSRRKVDHLLSLCHVDALDRVLEHQHVLTVRLRLATQGLHACLHRRLWIDRELHSPVHCAHVVLPWRVWPTAWGTRSCADVRALHGRRA